MLRHCIELLAFCALLGGGCAGRPAAAIDDRVTIFVPGVFGDGSWYDGLVEELNAAAGPTKVFTWGAPKAMFAANFSNTAIHVKAENELADKLAALPPRVSRIHLVGHSAGCGVILGALSKTNRNIQHTVLIAPSVSPQYELAAAARRSTRIDVFYSDRDTTFLKWRTGNFGTYDNIKTPAAGYAGFDFATADAQTQAKSRQHPYQADWRALGNDGGHGGGVQRKFVREVISPLLREGD
jgi:pimeloyl-ACP methyl ester carboxylesterase